MERMALTLRRVSMRAAGAGRVAAKRPRIGRARQDGACALGARARAGLCRPALPRPGSMGVGGTRGRQAWGLRGASGGVWPAG